MPNKFVLGVGISLILAPTHLSADADHLLKRHASEINPVLVSSIGDRHDFEGAMVFERRQSSKSTRPLLQPDLPQIEPRASENTVAQASRRGRLTPLGVADQRPSPGIDYDTLPKTQPSTTQHAPYTGTLFVQNVPKEAQAQYNKAVGLLKREDNDAAVQTLHRALEIFPDYFLALQAFGAISVRRSQFEIALKALSHAVEINPKADLSFLSMGIAQLNLGRIEESIRSLRQSTALNPSSPNAFLILGSALIQSGRLNEAEESLQRAYRIGGGRAIESQLYLANAYERSGRPHDAVNALQLYLKHAPKGTDKQKIKIMIEKLETISIVASK
jgi:predicted Zn-dependent protease